MQRMLFAPLTSEVHVVHLKTVETEKRYLISHKKTFYSSHHLKIFKIQNIYF